MNPPVLKSKRKAAASTKIMFDGENFNIASPFLRAVSSSPQINKGTDVQSEYPLNRARRSSVYKRQSGISLTSIDNSNIDTEVEIPSFLMNIVTAIQQINSQLNDEEFEKTKGVPRDLGEFQRINNISNEELVSSFFVVLQQYNVSLLVDVGECGRIQRPFGHSDIVSARVTVWKLNEQKRAILKSCVNIYRWLIDESGMIGSTLFKILIHSSFVNIQDMITIALFMECLKTHENEIFECEGHDPFFASDKIQCVIAGTQETLFNILFDPYFINEDYLWQYTNIIPYFMTQHQFLTQLLTSLNHFIKFCNSPGASMDEISVKKKRLERIVLMWIENVGQFIAETEPEVISLLLESDFLKSQQLDNHFILSLKEMTHSLILSNKNTQVHLHKKDAFKMENLFVETKIKEVDELASFKSKIFADQLVLFDHQQFAKLKGYDAYVDSGKDSLQQYVNCNRCIETWALLTGEKGSKKMGHLIKIAKRCLDLNGFNMAYIIYSVLVKLSISQPSYFNKLERSKMSKYETLEEIFKISYNFKAYRTSFQNAPFPKVPVLSIWMHDIINVNEMPTVLEGYSNMMNFQQLLTVANIVKMIGTVQTLRYSILPNQKIMSKLNSMLSIMQKQS